MLQSFNHKRTKCLSFENKTNWCIKKNALKNQLLFAHIDESCFTFSLQNNVTMQKLYVSKAIFVVKFIWFGSSVLLTFKFLLLSVSVSRFTT
jgi:hypothetical protein